MFDFGRPQRLNREPTCATDNAVESADLKCTACQLSNAVHAGGKEILNSGAQIKSLMIRWLSYRTGASMSRTLRLGIGIWGVRQKKKTACSRYSVGFETNLLKWLLSYAAFLSNLTFVLAQLGVDIIFKFPEISLEQPWRLCMTNVARQSHPSQ